MRLKIGTGKTSSPQTSFSSSKQASKDYLNILIKYNSILRNRNNVLKKTNNYNEVLPWDVQLAKHGVSIWEKRNIFNNCNCFEYILISYLDSV